MGLGLGLGFGFGFGLGLGLDPAVVARLDDDGGDVPDARELGLLEEPAVAREEAGHAVRAGEVVVLDAREGECEVRVGPLAEDRLA